MLCEKCQKNQATVIIKQTAPDGSTVTKHMCPECSFKFEIPISFEDLFQGFLETIQSMHQEQIQGESGFTVKKPNVLCPVCGMTFEQFKSTGKLGCAECYNTFSEEMNALLKSVQGSIHHEGKYPRRLGAALKQKREANQLRVHLKKAVNDENFEEAARLRDRIRALES